MDQEEAVRRFAALFSGFSKAHGVCKLAGTVDSRGKAETKNITRKDPPTLEHYRAHLLGTEGLGIIPLNDDNNLVFATIDVDDYTQTIEIVAKRVQQEKLPLVAFRSKSGGAHLTMFFTEPVPASIAVDKMRSIAGYLGYAKCELFPKQISRLPDTESGQQDIGNWINLPYFSARNTERYALKDGQPLRFDAFIEYAESMRLTKEQLIALELKTDEDTPWFKDGPPCLQRIMKNGGCESGGRNKVMYQTAWYLKQAFPDSWKTQMHVHNTNVCVPMLPHDEVETIIKNFEKRGDNYGPICNDDPMASNCDKKLCKTRKFGIGYGPTTVNYSVDSITKYDNGADPVYILSVNGARMYATPEQLTNQGLFRQLIFSKLNFIPPEMSKKRWEDMMNLANARMEIINTPHETSVRGQFFILLEKYVEGFAQAKDKVDLLHGHPYHTEENGEPQVWFTFAGLKDYLKTQGFKEQANNQISVWLQEQKVTNTRVPIEHRDKTQSQIRVWMLPYKKKAPVQYTTEVELPQEDF